MLRKDVERLLLDISSNQKDQDEVQQSLLRLKELVTIDPDLMKSYWDKISSYLYRKNVYVRIRATILLLELSSYVSDDQFDAVWPVLLRQIESDSIMVANTFASYIPKIIIHRPKLEEVILKRIIDTEKWKQKSRHWNIIKASIIEAMDQFMDYSQQEDIIIKFIKQSKNSTSPKTRKLATKVLKSRNLIES